MFAKKGIHSAKSIHGHGQKAESDQIEIMLVGAPCRLFAASIKFEEGTPKGIKGFIAALQLGRLFGHEFSHEGISSKGAFARCKSLILTAHTHLGERSLNVLRKGLTRIDRCFSRNVLLGVLQLSIRIKLY